MAQQYVTLVVQGGTPVRLADQTGAPYPTTGTGSLVFANGANLTNVTFTGQVIATPTGLGRGTLAAPALYFGSADNGIFSQQAGDVSLATGGVLIASFRQNVLSINMPVSNVLLNLFSDTANQASIQSTDSSAGVHTLTLNKYGGTVAIGNGLAPAAGGGAVDNRLTFTSSNVLVTTGTGAPTLSAARGSLYMRNDAPGLPYFNNDGATGWTALLTAANPNFTTPWTVTLGTITTNQPCTITETWNNGAINFVALSVDVVNTASAASARLFQLTVSSGDRFYVDKFGTVVANAGGFFGGNMNIETGSGIPAGGTQDLGLNITTAGHFGVYVGSGAPTSTQARGSLYLRSDGLPYYNLNGTNTWDQLAGLAAANAFSGANTFTAANSFTGGSITVTTQSPGNNTTLAASTAFVTAAVAVQGSATAPTTQNLTSGSGATYTTPAGVKWIKVRMVGGGGGGGGAGLTTSPTGGTGGTTTFNSINAIGGSGGTGGSATNGSGGAGGTGGTGTATLRKPGAAGLGIANAGAGLAPAIGGSTPLGGASATVFGTAAGTGVAAPANTGAGGSAPNNLVASTGCPGAGGGGEYVEIIIGSPAATYTYTIGAVGAGGIGTGTGAATGGAGGTGFITVEEHYNF